MHMLHIDGRISPGREQAFFDAWNTEILPRMKEQDGFVSEVLLFEDCTNAGIDISFWRTQEGAEHYLQNVLEKAMCDLDYLVEGRVTVYSCRCDEAAFQIINRNKAA